MIQIDMDMPKSCAVCRFNSRCDDCVCACNWCKAVDFKDDDDAIIGCFNDGTREYDPEIGFTPEDHRMEWCPLKEVKHGKWDIEISHDGYQATYRCSECGHQFKWLYDPHFPPVFNYCQKCGAYMRTDG